jgi:hypothetical protein
MSENILPSAIFVLLNNSIIIHTINKTQWSGNSFLLPSQILPPIKREQIIETYIACNQETSATPSPTI